MTVEWAAEKLNYYLPLGNYVTWPNRTSRPVSGACV